MSKRNKPAPAKPALPENSSAPAAAAPTGAAAASAVLSAPRRAPVAPAGAELAMSREQAVDLLASHLALPAAQAPGGDNRAGADNASVADETPAGQAAPATTQTETDTDNEDLTDPGAPANEPDATNESIAELPEELDDEDLDELADLTDEQLNAHAQRQEWDPSYTKRVKKFTRQLKAARAQADGARQLAEEREALRTRIAELEGKGEGTPSPQPSPPAGERESADPQVRQFDKQLAAIDQELAETEGWLDWAAQNPDGGSLTDKKGNAVMVDAPAVARATAQWRSRAKQLEREAVRLAARRETRMAQAERDMETQVRQIAQQAIAAYPWLNDTKSAEWKAADKFVRENPGIKSLPNWPLLVGQFVSGKTPTTNATTAGNGKLGTPATRPPARPAAAPLPASRRQSLSAAVSQAALSGDREAVGQALLATVVERRR